jgi:hypothetical protein
VKYNDRKTKSSEDAIVFFHLLSMFAVSVLIGRVYLGTTTFSLLLQLTKATNLQRTPPLHKHFVMQRNGLTVISFEEVNCYFVNKVRPL